MKKKYYLFLAFFVLLFTASFARAQATEYYVDPTGTNDGAHGTSSGTGAWQTIAYALSNVANPTTDTIVINIAAGTYVQNNVDLSINRAFTNLTLKGAGASNTFVQSAATAAASTSRVIAIGGGQNVTIRDLTVRYGRNEYGSGIYSSSYTTHLTLSNLIIDDNDYSSGTGGGIYNSSYLTLENSTISNNDCNSSNCGGGLYIDTYNHPEVISKITNTTFYKNAGLGGAITLGLHVHIIFTNNTIYQGSTNGNGIYNENNGDYVYFKNNIITDPTSSSYYSIDLNYGYSSSDRPEIFDGGNNVIETQTSGAKYTFTNGVNGDIVGVQSGLISTSISSNNTLNGTWTMALLAGSPAINTGDSAAHGPDGNQVTPYDTDQRGKSRNSTVDIGAFEYQETDDTDPVINSGSLASTNAYVDITFSEGVYSSASGSGALEPSDFSVALTAAGATAASISSLRKTNGDPLTGGETTIRANLSITGNPYGTETIAITPADSASIYDSAGNAMVSAQTTGAMTLTGGTFNYYVDPTGTDDGSHGTASGTDAWQTIAYALSHVSNPTTATIIINIAAGTYTQNNVDLSINRSFKNITLKGAGAANTFIQSAAAPASSTSRVINVGGGQTVILRDFTVRYGKNEYGAGIYQPYATTNLTLTNITVDDNDYSSGTGAGIYNSGNLTIENSTISNNDCNNTNCGGGLYVETYNHPELTTKITNTTFYKNAGLGGAITLGLHVHIIFTNNTIYQGEVNGNGIYNENNYDYVYFKNNIIPDPTSGSYASIDLNYGYSSADRPEIIDGGYNVIETQTSGAKYTFVNGVNGNIVGVQANLNLSTSLDTNGTLNGTPTLALSDGSVAINAGNDTAHGPDDNQVTPPSTDQRGLSRVGGMDMGAFEYGAVHNTAPALTSVTATPSPIKGGNSLTLSPVGQTDTDSDSLRFYCNESGSPTSANTLCSEANTSYASGSYDSMTCSYNVSSGDTTRTVYCRTYDGTDYSTERTTTYTVDSTAPAGGSIAYANGYNITGSVSLSTTDGTDGGAGLNTSTRILQRKSATLSNGTCGSYGSFSAITPTGTYPDFTDSTLSSGNCYQYQYLVSDNTSNQAAYASANVVKVDTAAPTVDAGSNQTKNALFTQNATATDTASGIASYQWSKQSGPGTITFGSDTAEDTTVLASTEGTYVLRLTVTDNAGNSNYDEFTLNWDLSGPTFSNIEDSPTSDSVTITWSTDKNSSSQVEYGLTSDYGNTTSEFDTSPRKTSHSVEISGLNSCARYYYRVISKDENNNQGTSDQKTFKTSGCLVSSISSGSENHVSTSGGSVSVSTDTGNAIITAPENFHSEAATIQINKLVTTGAPSAPEDQNLIGDNFFDLLAVAENGSLVSNFNQPVTFTVFYGSDTENGYDENTLDVYKYANGSWDKKNCTLDTIANTLTCHLNSFSVYGVFGATQQQDSGYTPIVAVGKNHSANLDENISVSLKSRKFTFRGKVSSLEKGDIVQIYKNGKLKAQRRISKKKKWRYSTKQTGNTTDTYQFKYLKKGSGEEVSTTSEYQLFIDKRNPRFTHFAKSATLSPEEYFEWSASDNDQIKYYQIKFQGKKYNVNESRFQIPANTKKGVSKMTITAFDRAENSVTKKITVRIQ